MTVTCLSCGAEYGQPHAASCEFRVAPSMRVLGGVLAAAALTAVALTACAPAAPSSPAGARATAWATADTPTTAVVDEQALDGSIAGNGTYAVGGDVQPGTYRSAGPADSTGICYWARLKDTTGDMDSIIANDVGKGPQVVTVKKTDGAFSTRGCATWTRAS